LVSNFGAVSSQLHRVFNRSSFGLGGRFYGPWWQNIPSESRSFISIDGVETVELDYPHLHPMLLYLEAGQRMHGEPYDLVGWPRKLVKVAFNTLVNARTRQAALRAIANEIGGEGAYAKARTLVEEIEARHRSIAQMFGTSVGLRLQRIDSDITEGIMLRLARNTVVALPIHDSYIVRGLCFEKGELMEAMGEGLWKVERNSSVRSVGYRKSIPQYGGGGGDGDGGGSRKGGVGSVTSGRLSSKRDQAQEMSTGDLSSGPAARIVIVFPEERQRDLFGGDRLNVPYREILGWRGGIALPGVQKALRREMRRRGLRHLDLADRVGVSRSHLEHIMDGRRGASSLVASRLRDFLVDGAKTVGMAA
jgi:hypothetical protein